ncbi:MAG: metallophosphoesterase [Sylvanvirus sp.]|uniref:Metallophosphoesterase n=1 Tax=Sylvanvirus sp. TaxID=2487774 RepID=A0A3G5AIB5_9VIRU|nr:MAG: metallophosphoesterase [Sylvanvirus sp.]
MSIEAILKHTLSIETNVLTNEISNEKQREIANDIANKKASQIEQHLHDHKLHNGELITKFELLQNAMTDSVQNNDLEDVLEEFWGLDQYNIVPLPPMPVSSEELAGSYLSTLLHWIVVALRGQLSHVRPPYNWFCSKKSRDHKGRIDTRVNAYTGHYLSPSIPTDWSEQARNSGSLSPTSLGLMNHSLNHPLDHSLHHPLNPTPSCSSSSRPVTLGILSDWASGTTNSFLVAKYAFQQQNDYNIHLGDTYFTGTFDDCRQNFCGQDIAQKGAIQFPRGVQGTFALIGNHEAYGQSIGFKKVIMPFCGTIKQPKQRAPFWSLETEHWIVIGLDSGYDSVDLLQWGPDNLDASNKQLQFQSLLIEWLTIQFGKKETHSSSTETNTQPHPARRGIILLSHHQPVCMMSSQPAFEQLADTLATIFDGQRVLWLWGHEHQLTMYRLRAWTNPTTRSSFSFFGRCVGNGGFPCENQGEKQTELLNAVNSFGGSQTLQCVEYGAGTNGSYGRNGWCQVTLQGIHAKMSYYLIDKLDKTDEKGNLQGGATNGGSWILFATETFSMLDEGMSTTGVQVHESSTSPPSSTWYNTIDPNVAVTAPRRTHSTCDGCCCCSVM